MIRLAGLLVVAALIGAAPASAHYVSPNYLSKIDRLTAPTKGITLEVINRADQLQLTNHSGREVIVTGYNNDPYARIEPDGTVSVNTRSPAYYLNDDYYANVTVPKGVDGSGPPKWKVVDQTGRFEWHDHRIHWMSRSRPPQVKDPGVKTKIFPWKVPVKVGDQKGDIDGTLYWVPKPAAPKGLLIGLSALLLLACLGAVVIRRRRGRAAPPSGGSEVEAW